MIARSGSAGVVTLVLVLATGCGSVADPASPPSTASAASTKATDFPIATFAAISEDPVSEDVAAEFQAALALHDVSGGGGMSATVMTAEGSWSGTTGTADGVRDLQVDDQFAIASITKSVVAAQVMLMVEAGELRLDDPVAEYLPEDLRFDTNGATIRHLLSHRSGLPDYYDLLLSSQETEFQRVWTPTEILELLPTFRTPPGTTFSYAETNYLLLSLVIEHLRGRPLADELRDGALAVDGLKRLVHQPDERPAEPMAMPAGASSDVLEIRGGFLPSLASATAYGASGAIASDSLACAVVEGALCRRDRLPSVSHRDVDVRASAKPRQLRTGRVQPGQRVRRRLWAHRTAARLHVVGGVPSGGSSGDRRAHQPRSRRRPALRVLPRVGPSAGRHPSRTMNADDYGLRRARSTPEFAKYKAITLGQCMPRGDETPESPALEI